MPLKIILIVGICVEFALATIKLAEHDYIAAGLMACFGLFVCGLLYDFVSTERRKAERLQHDSDPNHENGVQ